MTERRIIECDGTWCDPTDTLEYKSVEHEPEWVELEYDGHTRHYCPVCSWRLLRWASDGRSGGEYFTVQHNYVGRGFEEAHVGPGVDADAVSNAGTHSMAISPFLDEQGRVDGYIPETMEGWHFHIHDHLGVTIIGQHKSEPRVIIEPEEFETDFRVRETGSGYSFDRLLVEEGIDVERFVVGEAADA